MRELIFILVLVVATFGYVKYESDKCEAKNGTMFRGKCFKKGLFVE